MSVGALGVSAIDAPAYAKKEKEEKKEGPKFSEEFQKAFLPVEQASKDESVTKEDLLQRILATESTVSTPDDQIVFANNLYQVALGLENYEMASKGMEMMLDSGKVPAENAGQYNFIAGQLLYNLKDYPKARARLMKAAAAGYEKPELSNLISQTYMLEDDVAGGLEYIRGQLDQQIEAGKKPDEGLIERGFSLAYNNDMYADAATFANMRVEYYPSEMSWRNAVGVQRNFADLDDPEILDLMRLMHATGTMTEAREYGDYINAANYRRLPAEVVEIGQEGIDKGLLSPSDTFVAEAIKEGRDRSPGLRADMAGLASDAKAPGASGSLAIAAGDTYLNFGEAAKAAELYEVALTRPDVDRDTALTRLGIAQLESGDAAAAQETFAKVQGDRAPIAKLWAIFAGQQASAGSAG
tara:strand:+ start:60 stop:1295 length:1236 start_codon:yes stop_codon:yes gene_type:complete